MRHYMVRDFCMARYAASHYRRSLARPIRYNDLAISVVEVGDFLNRSFASTATAGETIAPALGGTSN